VPILLIAPIPSKEQHGENEKRVLRREAETPEGKSERSAEGKEGCVMTASLSVGASGLGCGKSAEAPVQLEVGETLHAD